MPRADWFGPALRRWHFPELDPPVTADGGGEVLESEAQLPPAADQAAAGGDDPTDPQPNPERVAAEIAAGYAEALQRGLAEGRENGYAEGFAAGRQEGQQLLAEEARRMATIGLRLTAPIAAVERTIEDALVGLALELARCVIGSEIARSPESLVHLIREALAQAPVPLSGLRIALNPTDVELVRALAPDIEGGGATLFSDGEIEVGGCLIAVEEGDGPVKDRRWRPRNGEAGPHIDLSLAARWRTAMLALFDGEGI